MVKIIAEGTDGKYSVSQLLKIMETLRSPDGCPWDKEQTHKSIRNDALEEAYEVADAIDNDDAAALCEELGDMLLQVVFHSRIATETGAFCFEDVVDGICKKLVLRHPHVFGEASADNSTQVLDLWDSIKKEEKHQETVSDTLKSVPKAFPALMRAAKVQKRAKKAGVMKATGLQELETCNLKLCEAVALGDELLVKSAYGEYLFKLAGLQQTLKTDAEESLNAVTDNFIKTVEESEESGAL